MISNKIYLTLILLATLSSVYAGNKVNTSSIEIDADYTKNFWFEGTTNSSTEITNFNNPFPLTLDISSSTKFNFTLYSSMMFSFHLGTCNREYHCRIEYNDEKSRNVCLKIYQK